MNKLITFLILFTLAAATPPEASAQKSGEPRQDTLCIVSSGSQNQVTINSKNLTQLNGCTDSLAVKGEIVQRGENNSVTISAEGEAPKNKKQITNKSQNSNYKNQTEPATSNQQPATCNVLKRSENPESSGKRAIIKVTQSGKNNTVKINSR